MKIFLASLLVISFAFAQDNYHAEPAPFTCSLDACLVDSEGSQIGFYQVEDRDGSPYLKLSTESSIFDIDTNSLCFTGNPLKASNILDGLIGNTNADFYNGGHINVLSSTDVKVDAQVVQKLLVFADDYETGDQEELVSVKKCK